MSETLKPRGPYAKTAGRRAAIARAALDIVIEKGHRGLTTSEVAFRAQLSERAMLYHYPSREHLLVAAIEAADEGNAALLGALDLDGDNDALATLPSVSVGKGGANVEVLRLFGHVATAAQDPAHPAHDFMVRHNAQAVAGLAQLVRERQRSGLAHPDIDPETAARQMLGAWRGLQSQWLVEPSFDLADEVAQAFRRLLGQPTMEARQMLDEVLSKI